MAKFEIIETVEVDAFPHYRKKAHFYYKVLNETHEISLAFVPDGEYRYAEIKYDSIVTANTFSKGSYEITEDEFNETFLRAIQLINEFKNK